LQHLDLGGTPLVDLAPLTRLTALQHLNLRGARLGDLAPLAGLTANNFITKYTELRTTYKDGEFWQLFEAFRNEMIAYHTGRSNRSLDYFRWWWMKF
jgi:hypothetical protein